MVGPKHEAIEKRRASIDTVATTRTTAAFDPVAESYGVGEFPLDPALLQASKNIPSFQQASLSFPSSVQKKYQLSQIGYPSPSSSSPSTASLNNSNNKNNINNDDDNLSGFINPASLQAHAFLHGPCIYRQEEEEQRSQVGLSSHCPYNPDVEMISPTLTEWPSDMKAGYSLMLNSNKQDLQGESVSWPLSEIMSAIEKQQPQSPAGNHQYHNRPSSKLLPEQAFEMLLDGRGDRKNNKPYGQSQYSVSMALSLYFGGDKIPDHLPCPLVLDNYLASFWEHMHPHFPVFWKVGRSLKDANGPVLLGMCALGAWALGRKDDSFLLHDLSGRHIDFPVNGSDDSNITSIATVQALLLNAIYLLFTRSNSGSWALPSAGGGNAQAGDIENAFVLLADAARKASLLSDINIMPDKALNDSGVDDDNEQIDKQWRQWGVYEERKRTMYAVYILTSLCMADLHLRPIFQPHDIDLRLPCDEDIFAAPSSQAWKALSNGIKSSEVIRFSNAYKALLDPVQNAQPHQMARFSMFGGLVLIAALNVTIHEYQLGRPESDQLDQLYEPALKAWEFLWRTHPHASLSQSKSPYGPLAAESIPLLNVAYVRLHADLSRGDDILQSLHLSTAHEQAVSEKAVRHRVLKAVGYALNALFLSEFFVALKSGRRNWSIVAPFSVLSAAIVVGDWIDKLVFSNNAQLGNTESRFLSRVAKVFPDAVPLNDEHAELEKLVMQQPTGQANFSVWDYLLEPDVLASLPSKRTLFFGLALN